MTNGDWIRSMSDYDLADFLTEVTQNCFNLARWGECNEDCPMYGCCNDQPTDNVEGWLSQPREEA